MRVNRHALFCMIGWSTVTLSLLLATAACAQVTVTISGNQALAQISLPLTVGTVDGDVTITFDTPSNLTAQELNLSASVITNPTDPTLLARLPACAPTCVWIDPTFPLLIAVPWLYHSGFEADETDPGLLGFANTYEIEIHTPDLDCTAPAVGQSCPATIYRLFKAPVSGNFQDYTDDMLKGSVRARGRDGAFSQFLIVADTRASIDVEPGKELLLDARINSASLSTALRDDLLGKLAQVQDAALNHLDYTAAIGYLDALIAEVQANAGTAIANQWSADHSLVNDAGEIEGLAQTLRYTLLRLQAGN